MPNLTDRNRKAKENYPCKNVKCIKWYVSAIDRTQIDCDKLKAVDLSAVNRISSEEKIKKKLPNIPFAI